MPGADAIAKPILEQPSTLSLTGRQSMRIVDVREVTKPIASPIRNAYIDF